MKLILQIIKIFRILGIALGIFLIVWVVLVAGWDINLWPYLEIIVAYPNHNLSNVNEFPIGLPFFIILGISAVKGDEIINYLETKLKSTNKADFKKSKVEEWKKFGGDMTEMMQELAEEAFEKGVITEMSEKEKKEINKKIYNKITKTQIKDRQIYGAIRAFAELMKVDGEMHPNEINILSKFSQDEQKKLSKQYSQHSEEFKFVWAKDENLYEALKTYNKTQINRFFDKLFTMAVIDGELKDSEINFLNTIYLNITKSDKQSSAKEVTKMYKNWAIKNGVR